VLYDKETQTIRKDKETGSILSMQKTTTITNKQLHQQQAIVLMQYLHSSTRNP